MFFKKNTNRIGVSIGSSSVKVAELKKSGKGYSLVHFGVVQLPEEAIQNKEIVSPASVVEALKGIVAEMNIKGRTVVTALSGSSVIVKKIYVEPSSSKTLDDAMLWEVEQYVPFEIHEVAFDYQVVNKAGPEGKMEVVLVACKQNMIDSYQSLFKEAGLMANIVDLDLFALQNVFELNYEQSAPVALIDIGATSLKMIILANGQPLFTREVAVGGKMLTNEIKKHLNLTYQEAELLKIDAQSSNQLPQEVSDLMHVMSENLASEIKRSLDFYAASNSSFPIHSVYLSGGTSRLPQLTQITEEVVGVPVQLLNPFQVLQYDPKVFHDDYIQAISSIAAIPIGLALRGFA